MAIINGPGIRTTNRLFAKKTVDIITSNWLRIAEINDPSLGGNQVFAIDVDSSLGFKVSQAIVNVIYANNVQMIDVISLNSFFAIAGSGGSGGSGASSGASGSGGSFLGATGTRIFKEVTEGSPDKYFLEVFIAWSEVYEEFAEALLTVTTVVGTDFRILPDFTINLLDRYEDESLESIITPTLLFQNNTIGKKTESNIINSVNSLVDAKTSPLTNDVSAVKSSLNAKADASEVGGLGDRVLTMEQTIDSLDASMDSFLTIVDSFAGLSRSFGASFEITVANWTGSGPYTATKTYTMLTDNDMFFIKGNANYNSAGISVSQSGSTLTFTTSTLPSETVGGKVIVVKVLGALE
jgi:hypothetical protein